MSCRVPILIHREAAHLELRLNGSAMVEFWYWNVYRHYNEVFVETAKSCAIFRCFGLVDFP
ncbi:hypothetical protein T02_6312 [Trichinella nativa]|uniref:Uncharacterized protein n=1 Tax=Trichinella nativa TaxID=6335 RepID=A0A0V1L8R6_9BILA|nr:hypothetical protein T02_6312 [Trichinella nativa]